MGIVSDEKLVFLACRHDAGARAELVKRHYKSVFMKCFGILGNVHDAEDAAQEVMLTAFSKLHKLRETDKFAAWVITIARNTCINYLRKKVRLRKMLEKKVSESETSTNEFPELHLAIGELPSEVREPLVMYYLQEKGVKTIAEDLQTSASAVYKNLKKATVQLHELLVEQGVRK